jgi:hypothetical protein
MVGKLYSVIGNLALNLNANNEIPNIKAAIT